MQQFRTFDFLQEARDFREEHGTGGWIFVDDESGVAVLFPPEMTPSAIMKHPMTRDRTGRLFANA